MEDQTDLWKVRYVECYQQLIPFGQNVVPFGKCRRPTACERDDLEVVQCLDPGYRGRRNTGMEGDFDELMPPPGKMK